MDMVKIRQKRKYQRIWASLLVIIKILLIKYVCKYLFVINCTCTIIYLPACANRSRMRYQNRVFVDYSVYSLYVNDDIIWACERISRSTFQGRYMCFINDNVMIHIVWTVRFYQTGRYASNVYYHTRKMTEDCTMIVLCIYKVFTKGTKGTLWCNDDILD